MKLVRRVVISFHGVDNFMFSKKQENEVLIKDQKEVRNTEECFYGMNNRVYENSSCTFLHP